MSFLKVILYCFPLLIFACLCVSYYIYIVHFCGEMITNMVEYWVHLVSFNIVFIMILWAFLATVLTPPAEVPEKYKLSDEEVEYWQRLTPRERQVFLQTLIKRRELYILTRERGLIRYCRTCLQIKPDRAHHCSTCEICVLKMDHHCPWLNSCIGFSNYKCFILLMMYCIIYSIYVSSTLYKHVFGTFELKSKQQNIFVSVCLIMAFVFGIVGALFFVFNCGMVTSNETVLERMREPHFVQNVTFDLGCRRNFLEVFGTNCLLWLFPIFSGLGTGDVFEVREIHDSEDGG